MIGTEDGRYSTNQIDFLINGKSISNSNYIATNFNHFLNNVGRVHYLAVLNQKMTH